MSLWVFGYGSLLWNPGFEVAEAVHARLEGYSRSFCMSSVHHRGSHDKPGLVLALDASEGHFCDGVALRVAPNTETKALEDLRARELVSSAYLERQLPVHLRDGRDIEAVTYVIDPNHVQYSADLSLETQAQIIASARGDRGPNSEYLFNTAAHLREIELRDGDLDWLCGRVAELQLGQH